MLRKSRLGFLYWCAPVLISLFIASSALATTYYYVGASSSTNALETNSSTPGTLSYACANAGSGTTVVLENGTYNGSPSGYTVANSTVTFQAQNWHGAIVENTTGSNLWGPSSSNPTGDICQGIVFGPSTGLGWSGGGGASWEFLDCVFTQNGGVGAGSSCLFQNCLFTDAYGNAIDLNNSSNQSIVNCVERRENRADQDDDATGNKMDFSTDLTINGLVAYDNNCPALWFDTSNDGWLIENSTLFGNHGGNNWMFCTVTSASSASSWSGDTQDGELLSTSGSISVPILGLTGANAGIPGTITAASGGSDPQSFTVSGLTYTPSFNDTFAVLNQGLSEGDGFITEANDDGTFNNNWVYGNTDAGYWDHSSGGTKYGGSGGLTITNNLFAYDGEGFFVWTDARDMGPASLTYNSFLFTPGSSSAFDSWGSTPGTYPIDASITFDHNDYDATNSQGNWAYWFSNPVVAGGLTSGSQPSGEEVVNGTEVYQDYLQNTSTFDQDLHSNTNAITFDGTSPSVYYWPAATDNSWTDNYFPNNTFGTSNSIHQINDSNGASSNTIDSVIDGEPVNAVLTIPVSAHSPLTGSGPYSCYVYDLNGRWVNLTVPTANESTFLAAVPPYVTCTTSNATVTYDIRITLNSTPPYNVTATYNPSGGSGGSLSGSAATAAPTYNLTTLGASDWRHWGRGTGNGNYTKTDDDSSGGGQISDVSAYGGSAGTSDSWNDSTRFGVTWTNGTPTASDSSEGGYIFRGYNTTTDGEGWTFTAPASTTSRTLKVLCGGDNSVELTITAALSDGSASTYSNTITYTGNQAQVYTFTYAAASAGQTLTITIYKAGGGSTATVDLAAAWLTGGGTLSGSVVTSSPTYALSTLGATDWRHWGRGAGNGNYTNTDHDSSGGSKISDVSTYGGTTGQNSWYDSSRYGVTWTNGTPTSSESSESGYIYTGYGTTTDGEGWTFTVPASQTSQNLSVLTGGDNSVELTITAALSDGSATSYSNTVTYSGSPGQVYTFAYSSGAASGATMTITIYKAGGPSTGCVDLAAAWLH